MADITDPTSQSNSASAGKAMMPSRTLSGFQLLAVLRLLAEVKRTTLSRGDHALATMLVRDLGGDMVGELDH